MTVTINTLERGGYSAFGEGAYYDGRCSETILPFFDTDETRALSVTATSAISSVTKSENGITSTTPSVSGAAFTATLSSLTSGGYIDFTVTLTSGPIQIFRIRSMMKNNASAPVIDYGWVR